MDDEACGAAAAELALPIAGPEKCTKQDGCSAEIPKHYHACQFAAGCAVDDKFQKANEGKVVFNLDSSERCDPGFQMGKAVCKVSEAAVQEQPEAVTAEATGSADGSADGSAVGSAASTAFTEGVAPTALQEMDTLFNDIDSQATVEEYLPGEDSGAEGMPMLLQGELPPPSPYPQPFVFTGALISPPLV